MEKDLESQTTLQEGFDKLYKKNETVFLERDISDEAAVFFRCHDIAHIVFGCDTSFFGEGVVKIWTVFGTTLGFWNHLTGYQEAGAFAFFRKYSWRHIAKNTFRLLVVIPKVILRAKRMKKLWTWSEHERYLDTSINEIRKEFGIRTVEDS